MGRPTTLVSRIERWWDSFVAADDRWVRVAPTHRGRAGHRGVRRARCRPAQPRCLARQDPRARRARVRGQRPPPRRRRRTRGLSTWAVGSEHFADLLRWTGRRVATVQTLLELLLVPISSVLLLALVRYASTRAPRLRRSAMHLAVLRVCVAGTLVYFACGVLNQLLELAMLARSSPLGPVAEIARLSSLLRRVALYGVLFAVANTVLSLTFGVWHPLRRFREVGSAYRIVIAIVVAHFALLQLSIPGEQSRDAIRLWPESASLAVWGIAATCLLSFAVAVLARRLSRLDSDAPARQHVGVLGGTGTVAMSIVGMACVIAGLALRSRTGTGGGIVALGVLVTVVALASVPLLSIDRSVASPADSTVVRPKERTRALVPALASMAPLVALEVAIVQAGLSDLVAGTTARSLVPLSVLVAGLAVVDYLAARRYHEWADGLGSDREVLRRRIFVGSLVALGLVAGSVAIWVVSDPRANAPSLGVHGILGTFLVLVTVSIGTLGHLVDGHAVPASLAYLGIRRIPIVTTLLVWGLLGNRLRADEYHEIRVLDGVSAARGVTVQDAFARWTEAQVPKAEPADGTRTVPGVPMFFVTAAGGGIRAATFTASAIDCLLGNDDPTSCRGDIEGAAGDRWDTVFAASGASGGSVGLASVVAQRTLGPETDWVRHRLGTDLLSAQLAWQLFVEAPNALLGLDPGTDRAEVLERAWEDRFTDGQRSPGTEPFLGSAAGPGWDGPLVFLTGTNLADGCRVTISPSRTSSAADPGEPAPRGATLDEDCRRRRLDGAGDTLDQTVARDIADYLCPNEDLRWSTAAFLSARFPLVSPTGVVSPPNERNGGCENDAPWGLSIGDGGYRDNTGAAALLDLWSVLEPLVDDFNRTSDRCIVPVLVEIDNGHRNRGATAPPATNGQFTAPLFGALDVFASRDAGPIEELAVEFSRPMSTGTTAVLDGTMDAARYVRVSLYEHPGVLAPLGWSLSDAAVDDLTGQLDRVEENREAVATVTEWERNGAWTCTIEG
ncbi:MAG: hypothetical protein R2705_20870 [Ilumatobacteraceae bacterium]